MAEKVCPRCKGTGRVNDERRKVTPEQLEEIRDRRAAGEMIAVLAADYGVTESLISRVAGKRISG